MHQDTLTLASILHLVLGFIWFFLCALGTLFLALEWRCKFDKAFLFHGSALLLLCGFTGVDLWLLPGAEGDGALLYLRLQHLCFLFFACFTMFNVLSILGEKRLHLTRGVLFTSILLSVLTFTKWIFFVERGIPQIGPLYLPLFGPFLSFAAGSQVILILKGKSNVQASEQKVLKTFLMGLIILAVFGLLDMLFMAFPTWRIFTSATLIGSLCYGLTISSIFVDRFLIVLRDRQLAYQKLESAYKELEEATNLRQIGESTAIINHEIKNYMFLISGNAQLLQEMEPLTNKGQELVRNILTGVDRMSQFSRDILEMSRTRIILEKHPVNLSRLIYETIDRHYANKNASFQLDGIQASQIIHGDWGRLEQAMVNLINNAIEAAVVGVQPVIKIKVRTSRDVLLLSIEDHGAGCSQEQMQNLFKAFYSTKKQKGGSGLGLSVCKNIIDSHGGRISAYSKNLMPGAGSGLKFQISFPNFADQSNRDQVVNSSMIVVTEDMEGIDVLLQVFRNICIVPRIISKAADLKLHNALQENLIVLVSPKAVAKNYETLKDFQYLNLFSMNKGVPLILDHVRGHLPEPLTEEYVLQHFVSGRTTRVKKSQERRETLAA